LNNIYKCFSANLLPIFERENPQNFLSLSLLIFLSFSDTSLIFNSWSIAIGFVFLWEVFVIKWDHKFCLFETSLNLAIDFLGSRWYRYLADFVRMVLNSRHRTGSLAPDIFHDNYIVLDMFLWVLRPIVLLKFRELEAFGSTCLLHIKQ